jgi:hypothetical protein
VFLVSWLTLGQRWPVLGYDNSVLQQTIRRRRPRPAAPLRTDALPTRQEGTVEAVKVEDDPAARKSYWSVLQQAVIRLIEASSEIPCQSCGEGEVVRGGDGLDSVVEAAIPTFSDFFSEEVPLRSAPADQAALTRGMTKRAGPQRV